MLEQFSRQFLRISALHWRTTTPDLNVQQPPALLCHIRYLCFQAGNLSEGEYNYRLLVGDNGPLVYPAGTVILYSYWTMAHWCILQDMPGYTWASGTSHFRYCSTHLMHTSGTAVHALGIVLHTYFRYFITYFKYSIAHFWYSIWHFKCCIG